MFAQTGTAIAAPKAGLRRLEENQRRRQTALARLTLRGIEFNGVDRHIIDNLLQGIDGQRCILIIRQGFAFPFTNDLDDRLIGAWRQ